jgi:hypothetical protein
LRTVTPWSTVPYIVMLPPLPDDEDGAPAQPAHSARQPIVIAHMSLTIRVSLLIPKSSF